MREGGKGYMGYKGEELGYGVHGVNFLRIPLPFLPVVVVDYKIMTLLLDEWDFSHSS